jgi:hypothetical protein
MYETLEPVSSAGSSGYGIPPNPGSCQLIRPTCVAMRFRTTALSACMPAGQLNSQRPPPTQRPACRSVSQSVSQLRKEVDSYLASRMLVGAEWHTDNHSIPSRTVLTHLTFLPHFRRRTDIKTLALVLHCLPSPTTHPFLFSGFLFSPLPASLDTGLCQSTDRL